jgi:hypothetical protein
MMADDLEQLVELLRLEEAHDAGKVSDADYAAALPPLRIGAPDAIGFLIVPRPMPEEAWLEAAADAKHGPGILLERTERDYPKPPASPAEPRYADGQPKPSLTARLKSLAGLTTRKLSR